MSDSSCIPHADSSRDALANAPASQARDVVPQGIPTTPLQPLLPVVFIPAKSLPHDGFPGNLPVDAVRSPDPASSTDALSFALHPSFPLSNYVLTDFNWPSLLPSHERRDRVRRPPKRSAVEADLEAGPAPKRRRTYQSDPSVDSLPSAHPVSYADAASPAQAGSFSLASRRSDSVATDSDSSCSVVSSDESSDMHVEPPSWPKPPRPLQFMPLLPPPLPPPRPSRRPLQQGVAQADFKAGIYRPDPIRCPTLKLKLARRRLSTTPEAEACGVSADAQDG